MRPPALQVPRLNAPEGVVRLDTIMDADGRIGGETCLPLAVSRRRCHAAALGGGARRPVDGGV